MYTLAKKKEKETGKQKTHKTSNQLMGGAI